MRGGWDIPEIVVSCEKVGLSAFTDMNSSIYLFYCFWKSKLIDGAIIALRLQFVNHKIFRP